MRRVLLGALLFLLVLILADTMSRLARQLQPAVSAPPATDIARAPQGRRTEHRDTVVGSEGLPGGGGTAPTSEERLARLAIRRRLREEAGQTYLDSLVSVTDSLIRRWPDPEPITLRVALVEAGPPGYQSQMAGFAREALERWQEANPAVRFALQADTTGAQITIRWIDRFGIDRTGQTDLTWNQRGVIQHASIYLAVNDPLGRPVPDQGLRTVALHEVGHAIGLPHSGEPDDLMFPATHAAQPTARDLRTAQLLYQLPPGDIRDR